MVPSSTRSILGKLFRFPVLNVADIPLEKSRTQELNLKQTFPPEGWLLSAVQGFPISSHVMLSQKRVNSVKAQCTCRKFCLGLSSHKFLLLYHFIGVSPCKQCKQCNIHLWWCFCASICFGFNSKLMISFRQRQFSSVEIVKVCHSSALVDWGKRGWSNREKYHMNYPTCLLHNCSPPRESPTSRNPTIHCAPHWISIQRISPKKKSLHRMKFQRNGHISSREIVLGVKFFS